MKWNGGIQNTNWICIINFHPSSISVEQVIHIGWLNKQLIEYKFYFEIKALCLWGFFGGEGWWIELKSFINRNIMALILKPLGIRKKKSLKNGSLHPASNTKMYSIIYELCFTKFKRVFCDLLIRFSLSIPKKHSFFNITVFLFLKKVFYYLYPTSYQHRVIIFFPQQSLWNKTFNVQ